MRGPQRLSAYIKYELEVLIYSESEESTRVLGRREVVILPRVKLPPDVRPIEIDDENRKGVYIHIRLPADHFVVGQPPIPFELLVRNPNQWTIREAVVRLVQKRQLGIAGVHEIILHETSVLNFTDFKDEYFHGKLEISLPSSYERLVPTTHFFTQKDERSPWKVDYSFVVMFSIKGIFSNMKFTIPINIVNDGRKDDTTHYYHFRHSKYRRL
jgi:hypothetical protein